jgi:hypothetical protein
MAMAAMPIPINNKLDGSGTLWLTRVMSTEPFPKFSLAARIVEMPLAS